MANTTNLGLGKLSGSEKLKTYPTVQAGNMDAIDSAFGSDFGVGNSSNVNSEISSLGDGIAILATGNNHAAIAAGQFVYVRKHGTLTDGLYTANNNINANATLSTGNLTANSDGGLNAVYSDLNGKIENLIPQKVITESSAVQSRTFSIPSNGRIIIDCLTNNITCCFSIIVLSNSLGTLSIQEKSKGSNVTFNTSVSGKLTVSFNDSRQCVFLIMANNANRLNETTIDT